MYGLPSVLFCLYPMPDGHTETGGNHMEVRRYINGKPVSGKDLPRQQVDNPVLIQLLRQARARSREKEFQEKELL